MARLGGKLASRPLHFIFLVDCSGSMSVAGKIRALNVAIREAIPHMKRVAGENPNIDLFVRVIAFSSGAEWHVGDPTPVEKFVWKELNAEGVTDMGQALEMVADQLKVPPMTKRAISPILVLISDGQPTDDFEAGLARLLAQPWGARAVRLAIAIGRDADLEVLQRFIGDSDVRPFQDVLIDLGTRLKLPGLLNADGNAKYPGLYADYMVNHQRQPGRHHRVGVTGPVEGLADERLGLGVPAELLLDLGQ